MEPKTLDHVALLGRRPRPDRRLRDDAAQHARHRPPDNFTLVGTNARRGKLTLFDAEGPRERGAFKHVALRVTNGLDGGAETELDARPRASRARSARRGAHRRRVRPRPRRALLVRPAGDRGGVRAVRLRAAPPSADGHPRVEVGGAYVEFHPGEPGDPEKPLLNHLAVLVDSADEHIAEAEEIGIESTTSSTRPTRSPSSSGARSACGSSTSSTSRVRADLRHRRGGHGRALRGRACARARRGTGRLREGRPRRRLDAAVELRHLALPRARTTSAPSVPAATQRCSARCGAARRRDRLARVARRAGGQARDRQPAHDRHALRPARA